jgi:hypothetical protein
VLLTAGGNGSMGSGMMAPLDLDSGAFAGALPSGLLLAAAAAGAALLL